ncbi:hypothetical protein BD310DRAFT_115420 [Dichomitus squalens]|uniref:Uncharacterized protein n=1 Tax=Dichomitus squalens TaxID=114155 RepID=A0A4Q9Q4K6_9APHY|nr:hypothetical protein BD310DRAFT_115420 [Dichomitus squalens]
MNHAGPTLFDKFFLSSLDDMQSRRENHLPVSTVSTSLMNGQSSTPRLLLTSHLLGPIYSMKDGCHLSSSLRRVTVPDLRSSMSPRNTSLSPVSLASPRTRTCRSFESSYSPSRSCPAPTIIPHASPVSWYDLSPTIELRTHYITNPRPALTCRL